MVWKGKKLTFIPIHKFGQKRKEEIFVGGLLLLLLFIQIFWYMTPSQVVNIYSFFEETSCLHPHGNVAQCNLTLTACIKEKHAFLFHLTHECTYCLPRVELRTLNYFYTGSVTIINDFPYSRVSRS